MLAPGEAAADLEVLELDQLWRTGFHCPYPTMSRAAAPAGIIG